MTDLPLEPVTHDPSPDRETGSGRLWTDPREEDEHQHWLRPRTPPPVAPEPEDDGRHGPTAGELRARRLLPFMLAALAAAMLLGAGVLGASILNSDQTASVAPLPVVKGAAPADQRSKTVRSIYANVSPSVVRIQVQEGGAEATGTGFVIDRGGTIVTNAHVVGTATTAQVRLDDSAATIDAQVLGTDASSDLAVLRVDSAKTAHLRPLSLADSDSVQVGDLAVAIGYPLGLDRTATAGIVSGVGRAIKAPNGFSIDKVIQTDAPINPGNSGGPLLDGAGRVIGVNSQIATASSGGGNVGIGFAVPSNTVSQVVPRLESGGTISRPYLGVSTQASISASGAQVAGVVPGGPADAGGLRDGDIIVNVAGKEVLAPEDISTAIESRKPGDQVPVEIQRAGAAQTLHITLGKRPDSVSTP
ncbi:MAG TPA: trypsin-like peptidase domain-containing protein [Solirubrobacteraceae bacterium]|nr:trypsin-like peptidase domain-containing protein [Solirubrobacteraceae bacterium]